MAKPGFTLPFYQTMDTSALQRRPASRAVAALAAAIAAQAVLAQAQPEAGKVSGVIYADFYSVSGHHDATVKGKDGFWVRRINLTYDKKFDEKLSARLNFEAKDPGDFSTSSNMEPFVKDAWVRYTVDGHRFTLGLIPTPTFGPAENKLGYRPIEKTPIDLYRMGSSRDKGISVEGPLDKEGRADYMVMVGDGSGVKSSTGGTRTLYARVGYKITPEVSADLYGDSWKKAGGVDWNTLKGEVFYQGGKIKAGAAYASQLRKAPGAANLTLNVLSLYGEVRATERLRPFVRLDIVNRALPDADKIEFYKMSKDGKPTLVMVGARYQVHDQLEIAPSLTIVRYRSNPAGANPGSDTIFRVTFSLKF